MNPSAYKLARRYQVTGEVATELVQAGYRNPATLRRATLADLQKVRGVGLATARRLKGLD